MRGPSQRGPKGRHRIQPMNTKEHLAACLRLLALREILDQALAYRVPPIRPQDFTVPPRYTGAL